MNSREQLAGNIRDQILNGELPPGAKLPSVRKIAETEKHSQPTVVGAIEILVEEGYLLTKKRKGVYVADQTAWHPRVRRVGILTSVITSYATGLIQQVPHLSGMAFAQNQLINEGSSVSIHGAVYYPQDPNKREYVPLRTLGVEGVDVLLTAGIYDIPYLCSLQGLGIPIIGYDIDASAARMDSSFVDDIGSAFDLTSALAEQGHSEIAYVGRPMNRPRRELQWSYDPCSVRRADGYRMAMRRHGLRERVFHAEDDADFRLMARAVVDQTECTAVVMQDGGALAAMADRGIDVGFWSDQVPEEWPEDVSAIAVIDPTEMGRNVCELLEHRLSNPDAPVQRRMIQPSIHLRP